MKRLIMILLLSGLRFSSLAQNEFTVHTTLDSTQRDPRIVIDGGGNYAIVWTSTNQASAGSFGDIYLRRFNASDTPLGGETLVNVQTVGHQKRPSAAMDGAGDLIVVWASQGPADSVIDVRGRLFRAGMSPGAEFVVNAYRPSSQTNPAVAMDNTGRFAVVWESWEQDGSDRGVYGQLFAADGSPLGSEFRVNETTSYSQARPAVRFFSDGRFIVVWESWGQDVPGSAGYGVFGRQYASSGVPSGSEFQVNTYPTDYQWQADVEVFDDDAFAVVWCSWGKDGDEGTIALQHYDPAGQKIGGEVVVNTTTQFYQWLPKIRRVPGGGAVVVWSSWKQDGDREGVYAQVFDVNWRKSSFETRMNTTVSSFQWEPDFFVPSPNTILGVWSSWGQNGKDYDVVARRVAVVSPQGFLAAAGIQHAAGRSTSRVTVHVVDSLALTGQSYEVMLDSLGNAKALARIRNVTTGDTVVPSFPIDRGEGVFYLSPVFAGIAVEVVPEFDFLLNAAGSWFANHSGANVQVDVRAASAGTKRLAPIDVVLVWGNPDTLVGGQYAVPLDTAYGTDLVRNVVIPFRAVNLTEGGKVEILIVETKKNQRWEPGEKILFRTPPPYRQTNYDTHAEVVLTLPGGQVLLPRLGDSTVALTMRPIRPGELYTFVSDKAAVVEVREQQGVPVVLRLEQNYPNPFNPVTTIRYTTPAVGRVTLAVYNVLGQKVRVLVDGVEEAGLHRVMFDGRGLASGVYFCRLEFGSRGIVQRMVLVR